MAEMGAGLGRVTVDQLIALNDEIAALTRAGVPLERGLLHLGSDVPGRLGRIANRLGEKLNAGESLSEALASAGEGMPRLYLAVVEAGLRSGRLPVALEGLSAYARGIREAKRSIGMALWYPLIVLSLAYGLFLFLVWFIIPKFVFAFHDMGLPVQIPLLWLDAVGRTVPYWWPIGPGLLLVLMMLWSGSRLGFGAGWFGWVLLRLPWMGPMVRGYEAASYADLLALLVEHGVPYPEALKLAGEASGDRSLARSSRDLAEAVERGVPPAEALRGRSAFPPILRWLLATVHGQAGLVTSLRQMAERYRGQARYQAEKIRVLLPTVLLIGIGGTVTAAYVLTLFLPLTLLWKGLAGIAP